MRMEGNLQGLNALTGESGHQFADQPQFQHIFPRLDQYGDMRFKAEGYEQVLNGFQLSSP